MRASFAVTLLIVAASCRSDDILGPGDAVLGSWGGTRVAIEASATAMSVTFDCEFVQVASPVVVRSDGTFAAEGVHYYRWVGSQHVSIEGRTLPGNQLALRLGPPLSRGFVLKRDRRPDFGGFGCPGGG